MKFEHGHPKYGGRKVGTPNKSNALAWIQEQFPGFDPLVEMVRMIHDKETSPELKKSLLSEIAAYTTPKFKAIELTEDRRLTDEAVISLAGSEQEPAHRCVYPGIPGRAVVCERPL